LSVMIAQAKEDKVYADTIAGIFEGTYPTYKALNLPFILKSFKQGGNELGNRLSKTLSNPESVFANGMEMSGFLASLLNDLNEYRNDHMIWLKNTVGKTISVAGHVLQNVVVKR
jgi:menaquinone-9 beta-reductase